MPIGYLIKEQQEMHFLTFQIVKWIDLFTRKVYRDIIIESLEFCQENKHLEIYGFVIMSNHVHLLARSTNATLSDTIRDFKSYTAKRMITEINQEQESRREWMLNLFEFSAKQHKRNATYQIWTHENHAEIVYSNYFFEQKLEYIHQNPVRAGWVEYAEEYIYSSAGEYAGKKGMLNIIKEIRSIEKIKRTRSIK